MFDKSKKNQKMRAYNWREEREKYRTNLNGGASSNQQQTPPQPPAPAAPKGNIGKMVLLGLAVCVVLGVVAFALKEFMKPTPPQIVSIQQVEGTAVQTTQVHVQQPPAPQPQVAPVAPPPPVPSPSVQPMAGDSAVLLANMAEKYKTAVGVVTICLELKNGEKFVEACGTAWAFGRNRFATNAHVARGLKTSIPDMIETIAVKKVLSKNKCEDVAELKEKKGEKEAMLEIQSMVKLITRNVVEATASIVINGSYRKVFPVSFVQVHREYGVVGTDFNPDVAILTIQGSTPVYFNLANTETLHALKPGEPIAYLGFPMESLVKGNMDMDNPVASFQSGNIVAVTDFSMKRFDKEGNYLIRHNLPSAGGASGSPIFTRNGEVIALHYAANYAWPVQAKNGGMKVSRTPSAAHINFGVRVDLLSGVGNPVSIRDFLR